MAGLVGVVVGRPAQGVGAAAGDGDAVRSLPWPDRSRTGAASDRRAVGAGPVEAPVRDRAGDAALRSAGRGRRGHGREAGEALLEVDRDGEPVVGAGEFDLLPLQLVEPLGGPAQDPRGERLDVDDVPGQVEAVEADHRRAAVVAVLVVGEVQMDVVAGGVRPTVARAAGQ